MPAALALQPLHHRGLLVGQHVRFDDVDPHPAPDGLGGDTVVAGQHHDAEALGVQRADGLGRAWLDRIGHAEDPRHRLARDQEHHGLTLAT